MSPSQWSNNKEKSAIHVSLVIDLNAICCSCIFFLHSAYCHTAIHLYVKSSKFDLGRFCQSLTECVFILITGFTSVKI